MSIPSDVKMWNNWNSHTLLAGMQNSIDTKNSLMVSYKVKYIL